GPMVCSFRRTTGCMICASPPRRISARSSTTPPVANLGRIELRNVMTTGRVQILARDKVRGGRVDVNGLDIIAADTRAEKERPHGYGVYVLHGAFTLWNMQFDDSVLVSANLVGPRISLDTPAPTVQTLLPNHP